MTMCGFHFGINLYLLDLRENEFFWFLCKVAILIPHLTSPLMKHLKCSQDKTTEHLAVLELRGPISISTIWGRDEP